jgi:hypothetical protein
MSWSNKTTRWQATANSEQQFQVYPKPRTAPSCRLTGRSSGVAANIINGIK